MLSLCNDLNMWPKRKVCMWKYLENTEFSNLVQKVKLFVCFVISGFLGDFVIVKFLMKLGRVGAHGGHCSPMLLDHGQLFHGTSINIS